MKTLHTMSMATAVAALLVASGCSSDETTDESGNDTAQSELVKCEGINECKGTSECKSATNENGCQGLNDCKGQGWVTVSEDECDEKGGTVLGGEAG